MPSHLFVLLHPDGREEIFESDQVTELKLEDDFTRQDTLWRVVGLGVALGTERTVVACVRDDWYQSAMLGQRPLLRDHQPLSVSKGGQVVGDLVRRHMGPDAARWVAARSE
jgi:hypothetical protein